MNRNSALLSRATNLALEESGQCFYFYWNSWNNM